uniref:RNase III domain-containing protein n=1 Tax=Meloidogyne incognita TaxID=6306 RepID=A0A914NN46_MELIC
MLLKGNANLKEIQLSILAQGIFYSTGICSDMVLHSILLVLACQHVRFHCSLNFLEERLAYTFKNRSLLELALIHPSFRANYGTNSDHAKKCFE